MKLRFLPADAHQRHDGILHDRLWNLIPNFVSYGEDVTIVGISHFSDYQFNPELLNLRGKKYIIADTLEIYDSWPEGKTHLFGISETPAFGGNTEWQRLSQFVKDHPPVMQFVRELYLPDVSKFIQPLEWPCTLPEWAREDKINYNGRPFEVLFNWGFSNCSRPNLHGDIFKGWCKGAHEVISSWDHIDAKVNDPVKKFISIHSPHTHRIPITEIVRRQAQSKITVSLRGAGIKCFRSTEAPVHSVPAIHDLGLAWSHPWIDKVNSIHLQEGREYLDLLEALRLDQEGHISLHEIYLAAQGNIQKYRMPAYFDNYLRPAIERVL